MLPVYNVGAFPLCSRGVFPDADRSRLAPLRLIRPTIKPTTAVVHKPEFRSIFLPAAQLVARRHSQNYAEKIKSGRLPHPPPTAQAPNLPRTTRHNRPISARFDAVARRVTQDPEGPFCPIKVRTARGFVTTDYQLPGLRPNGASRALSGKTTRTKRRNKSLSTGR